MTIGLTLAQLNTVNSVLSKVVLENGIAAQVAQMLSLVRTTAVEVDLSDAQIQILQSLLSGALTSGQVSGDSAVSIVNVLDTLENMLDPMNADRQA